MSKYNSSRQSLDDIVARPGREKNLAEDFFSNPPISENIYRNSTHEVQEVQKEQEVYIHHEIGSTQGKKGQKLKRINMAFSDTNHEYITHESRRRGISSTAFVNYIIDEYRNK